MLNVITLRIIMLGVVKLAIGTNTFIICVVIMSGITQSSTVLNITMLIVISVSAIRGIIVMSIVIQSVVN